MNNAVEEIKKKIDIVEYIGSFVTLKKAGRNFKANCPFHQEKTPSFVVSPDRQIWHCFGSCAEGGDIIKFLMKWENITFIEALRELADKAGVKLTKVPFEDKNWSKKERLLSLNQLAAEYFHYVLTKSKYGQKALEYLKSRDIKPAVAKKFQLGYAPSSWDSLNSFLKKKKFSPEEIYEGGLTVKSDRSGFYDRFRGRLVFPIKDGRGNVIGFSGRLLDEAQKEAKYVNTPETPIYHKRESLFGIDLARDAIKKEKNVYLVEGEFDVISPYQKGFENFVAIKGSAVTREQLLGLKRFTNHITLALDADNSGEEAMKRGIEEAEHLDFEIDVVTFEGAKDPDEAIRADEGAFAKALRKKSPIYDFLIDLSRSRHGGDSAFAKRQVADDVIPFVERIQNPILQSHYVKKMADILEVSDSSVEDLIRRIRQKRKRQQFLSQDHKKHEEEQREVSIQKYLLSIIFQHKAPYELSDKVFQIITLEDFSIRALSELTRSFQEFQKKNAAGFDPKTFSGHLAVELKPVFDELYLYASFEGELDGNIERLAQEIKKSALKRAISEMLSAERPPEKDQELRELSLQLKEVEKILAPV